MKILKCTACEDLVPMDEKDQSCGCGACTGRYVNLRKVVYRGPGKMYGVRSLDYHRGDGKWQEKMFPVEDTPYVEKQGDDAGN